MLSPWQYNHYRIDVPCKVLSGGFSEKVSSSLSKQEEGVVRESQQMQRTH